MEVSGTSARVHGSTCERRRDDALKRDDAPDAVVGASREGGSPAERPPAQVNLGALEVHEFDPLVVGRGKRSGPRDLRDDDARRREAELSAAASHQHREDLDDRFVAESAAITDAVGELVGAGNVGLSTIDHSSRVRVEVEDLAEQGPVEDLEAEQIAVGIARCEAQVRCGARRDRLAHR